MVVYLARCRDEAEAGEVQARLISACPSLIYSRILHKPPDLDFYNADLLRSNDEQFITGQLAFEQRKADDRHFRSRMGSLFPWVMLAFVLAGLFFSLAGLLLARVISTNAPGTLAIGILWIGIFTALGVLALVGAWATSRTASSRGEAAVYEKAERWLKNGRPVVIAASEGVPDEQLKLPGNVIYFDRVSKQVLQRSA